MDFIKSFVSFLQNKDCLIQASTSNYEPQNTFANTEDSFKEPDIVELQNCSSHSNNKNDCNSVKDLQTNDNSLVSNNMCNENQVYSSIIPLNKSQNSTENSRCCDELKNGIFENGANDLNSKEVICNSDMQTTDLAESNIFNVEDIAETDIIATESERDIAEMDIITKESEIDADMEHTQTAVLAENLINLDDIVDTDIVTTDLSKMDDVHKESPDLNTDLANIDIEQKVNVVDGGKGDDTEVFDLDEFYNFFKTDEDMPLGSILDENDYAFISNDDISKVSDENDDDQIKEVSASEEIATECMSVLDEYCAERVEPSDVQNINSKSDTSVLPVDSIEKDKNLQEASNVFNEKHDRKSPENNVCAPFIEMEVDNSEIENKVDLTAIEDTEIEFVLQPSRDEHENTTENIEQANDEEKAIVSINSSQSLISISSTEDMKVIEVEDIKYVDSDSECEGYHSSDFEFITESEAEMDGLIINYSNKQLNTVNKDDKSKVYTLEIVKETNKLNSRQESLNDEAVAGPSGASSKVSEQNPEELKNQQRDYYTRVRQQYYMKERDNSRENHQVPNDGDYIEMFQRTFAPVDMDFYFIENKSVLPTTSMNAQYRGLGFDLMVPREEPEEDRQYQDEAKESAKRILEMYPGLNRKRRRRH